MIKANDLEAGKFTAHMNPFGQNFLDPDLTNAVTGSHAIWEV